MTAETWRTREAFVDADPDQQKLNARHTHQIELVQKAEQELRARTYKLQRLLLAREVVQRHAFNFESVSEEQETGLKLTGQDSEGWFCDFDNAADDLSEIIVQMCSEVASLAQTRDRLQAEREKAWDARHANATKLRKDWDETHGSPEA